MPSLHSPLISSPVDPDLSQGEFLHLLLALGAGMTAATLYAIALVLPLVWWSDPRYIIPAVAGAHDFSLASAAFLYALVLPLVWWSDPRSIMPAFAGAHQSF